ncbi:Ion channel [Legionella massiliensis]|uniref:Ion channel n=1 Tax=Legionella massiliensis TaxID=1034943 RepID=A0A078KXM6_9GAMM|nr:ion channel [Legionella massiliensis]CDZ76504.1 Ion channel [Legionella massiliensis]CEE12242.1 Ion channel [Legionella massiliensis]
MMTLLKKLRFLFLFIVILAFCLLRAIVAQTGQRPILDIFFLVLIVLSLIGIAEQKQKFIYSLFLLGAIEISLILMNFWSVNFPIHSLKLLFAVLFFLLMTIACLRLTLKDKTISITTLFGSLSAYLFIGLTFAYLYLLIYLFYPQSITGFEPYLETRAIYYSFITLTTVGFGDVVATGPIMQCLSWMEAFCGQAYLAIVISLLVGRYVATAKS